jgi:hypothetical protein
MRLAAGTTVVTTGLVLWGMGYWLTSTMTWWIALPLCWGVGWVTGWVVFAKVLPFIYERVMRHWIMQQPEHLRYPLLLRLYFAKHQEKEKKDE